MKMLVIINKSSFNISGCEFSIEIDMKSFNRSRYFRIKTSKEWRKIERKY